MFWVEIEGWRTQLGVSDLGRGEEPVGNHSRTHLLQGREDSGVTLMLPSSFCRNGRDLGGLMARDEELVDET